MFDRSGMTSKSAFIKARIFGEPFHVVTFDKSLHEYYTKFFAVQSGKAERSDFHAQFRMVGNRSAIGRFACKELQPNSERIEKSFLRTKSNGTCMQVGEIHDAVSTDYA